MEHCCYRCNTLLTGDEISLYRKMVSRAATEFLCLDCMSADLNTPRIELEKLIAFYHRTGICTLFAKWENNEDAEFLSRCTP